MGMRLNDRLIGVFVALGLIALILAMSGIGHLLGW